MVSRREERKPIGHDVEEESNPIGLSFIERKYGDDLWSAPCLLMAK